MYGKLPFLLIFVGLIFIVLKADSYISEYDDNIYLDTDFFKLSLKTEDEILHPVQVLNKISAKTYDVNGDLFRLIISFPGDDITPPKITPAVLTSKDFKFQKFFEEETDIGINCVFIFNGHDLEISLIYKTRQEKSYSRLVLLITNQAENTIFIESADIILMNFSGIEARLGGFGQPVYAQDLFFGIEFPSAYSEFDETGTVRCWHRVGKRILPGESYQTYPAVIGICSTENVQASFFNYIDDIRSKPVEPFLLYNTWYDIRDFNEEKLFSRIDEFKKTMYDTYKLRFDAFVVDDGWDDKNSVWEIDKARFPQGFSPLSDKLKQMSSRLGLWTSPWNGYDKALEQRIAWAKNNGYIPSGNHLCLGEPAYYKQFLSQTLKHLKDGNLSFYKIDGFLSLCSAAGHKHLPGIYSRVFLTQKFIDILKEIKRVQPDIYIDITVGTWLSPWWLMYADAVWMTGADFGHAEDVPAYSERDKAITFRDYTLYKIFKRENLQFPLSSIMTHGIIKGHLNLLGGSDETFRNWQDNALMYFSRGVMLWELYISPEVLSKEEWIFMSGMIKWAYENKNILANSRYIGGNPYEKQIYGYFHKDEQSSLLLMRNPFVAPDKIKIALSDLFNNSTSEYLVQQIYPRKRYMPETLSREHALTLSLQGYEVGLYRLIPMANVDYPVIAGVVYQKQNDMKLFVDPTELECVRIFNRNKIDKIYLNEIELSTDELERFFCKQNKYKKFVPDTAVQFNAIGKDGISGSFRFTEQSGRFIAEKAILLQFSAPVENIQINTNTDNVVIKKGNYGRWYWLIFPDTSAMEQIEFQLKPENGKKFPGGQMSIWVLGQIKLIDAGILKIESDQTIPADMIFPQIDGTRSNYNFKLTERDF